MFHTIPFYDSSLELLVCFLANVNCINAHATHSLEMNTENRIRQECEVKSRHKDQHDLRTSFVKFIRSCHLQYSYDALAVTVRHHVSVAISTLHITTPTTDFPNYLLCFGNLHIYTQSANVRYQ